MTDQFAWWRAALAAKQNHLKPPERQDDVLHTTSVGTIGHRPPCGYYRRPAGRNSPLKSQWEAIAFYPDGEDIVCERQDTRFMPRDLDEMAELFAGRCEPVSYQDYIAVTREGKPWPDDLDAFGLPPLDDAPENPNAVPGHNQPPEKTEAEKTLAYIEAAERQADEWLKQFPDITKLDATQGDLLSRYAVRFRELKQEADKKRKDEVEPHLKAQKDINTKWNPVVARAQGIHDRFKGIWDRWRDAAQRKADEAARKANEAIQAAAEEERRTRAALEAEQGVEKEPPPPVPLVQPTKIKGATGTRLSSRSRTAWIIDDLPNLAAHIAKLENPPADFVQACQAFANRFGPAGNLPGVRQEKQSHVA